MIEKNRERGIEEKRLWHRRKESVAQDVQREVSVGGKQGTVRERVSGEGEGCQGQRAATPARSENA